MRRYAMQRWAQIKGFKGPGDIEIMEYDFPVYTECVRFFDAIKRIEKYHAVYHEWVSQEVIYFGVNEDSFTRLTLKCVITPEKVRKNPPREARPRRNN